MAKITMLTAFPALPMLKDIKPGAFFRFPNSDDTFVRCDTEPDGKIGYVDLRCGTVRRAEPSPHVCVIPIALRLANFEDDVDIVRGLSRSKKK